MIVYDCHVCIKLSGALHCQQETWHIFCKELFYLRVVFFSCRESIGLSSLSCCWPKQAHVWKLVLHINHLLNLVVIVHSVISFLKKSLNYGTKSTRLYYFGLFMPNSNLMKAGSIHCNHMLLCCSYTYLTNLKCFQYFFFTINDFPKSLAKSRYMFMHLSVILGLCL